MICCSADVESRLNFLKKKKKKKAKKERREKRGICSRQQQQVPYRFTAEFAWKQQQLLK